MLRWEITVNRIQSPSLVLTVRPVHVNPFHFQRQLLPLPLFPMDAPTLILVPPTPLRLDNPGKPPPISASSQAHQRPMSFHQNRLSKQEAPGRDSTDAIYSIYSMYGDDNNPRASVGWANAASNHDRNSSISSPTVKIDIHKDRPTSSLTTNSYVDSDLAYYSPELDTDPPQPPLMVMDKVEHNGIVGNDESPRGSLTTSSSARPPSSYATPSSMRAQSDFFEDSGVASGSNLRKSDLSATSYTSGPSEPKDYRRSVSPNSRRSSRGSASLQQRSSLRDLPPLPPSSHNTPSPTPPRQLSPSPALLTPKTSMKSHGKHPAPVGSPSSKVSLVPSEGEDLDGFHVRNTYAQLEVSGVKGDGYEEGVERTRARIGTSRTSQLQAEAALGDGDEKKRSLEEKEIKLLRSVDR